MELINSVTGSDEEGRSRQRILTFAAQRLPPYSLRLNYVFLGNKYVTLSYSILITKCRGPMVLLSLARNFSCRINRYINLWIPFTSKAYWAFPRVANYLFLCFNLSYNHSHKSVLFLLWSSGTSFFPPLSIISSCLFCQGNCVPLGQI